jgi:general secretion pathway protein C
MACAGAYLTAGWWSAPTDVPANPGATARLSARPEVPARVSDALAQPLPSLPATAVPSSRYQLNGVMAGTAVGSNSSVALIAVDGGAARAFRVGDAVDGELLLLGVSTGSASLGPPHGSPTVWLQVTSGASSSDVLQSRGVANSTTGAVGTPPAAQVASSQLHPGRRVRLQHQNPRP